MNERGLSESTQWAILVPVLLVLVLGLVQLGVWLYARSVASQAAAAVADLRAAGVRHQAEAKHVGERIATGGGLAEVAISFQDDADTVVVTVSGRAPLFFDIGQGLVLERAVLPLERVGSP